MQLSCQHILKHIFFQYFKTVFPEDWIDTANFYFTLASKSYQLLTVNDCKKFIHVQHFLADRLETVCFPGCLTLQEIKQLCESCLSCMFSVNVSKEGNTYEIWMGSMISGVPCGSQCIQHWVCVCVNRSYHKVYSSLNNGQFW